MHSAQPSLFARNDTFFGVCEALGEDFGFNPLPLRVAFGVLLLWNPMVIMAIYVAAGICVALSRWIFPNARVSRPPRDSKANNREQSANLAVAA